MSLGLLCGMVIDAVWIYMYWDAYDSGEWIAEVQSSTSRDVCVWVTFFLMLVIRPVLAGLLIRAGFLKLPGAGSMTMSPNEGWKVRNEDYNITPKFDNDESVQYLGDQLRESI